MGEVKTIETREQALERLLRVAVELLNGEYDAEERLTPQQVADSQGNAIEDITPFLDDDAKLSIGSTFLAEALFWLECKGEKPMPTEPSKRLGAELLVPCNLHVFVLDGDEEMLVAESREDAAALTREKSGLKDDDHGASPDDWRQLPDAEPLTIGDYPDEGLRTRKTCAEWAAEGRGFGCAVDR